MNDVTEIERELEMVGLDRHRIAIKEVEIRRRMVTALRSAYGQVPVAQAARLLGIDRTHAYRLLRDAGLDPRSS